MAKELQDERHLPTRDICYAYAAAMHFAQAFEQNLRAFLYAALAISQAIRDQAEHESDRRERVWIKINEDLPLPSYDDIKRKYVIPSKRKK